MPTHAAFLRAINLGSTRKISSSELRTHFGAMGFDDVDTFRTSGNVVFTAAREPAAKLTAHIEKALSAAAGFEVVVFLRTAAELRAIAAATPFPAKVIAASKGKLQVALLPAKPPRRARDEALALATDADQLAFGGRELYWLPSGGTQQSALDMKAISNMLGPVTMRTKGTIELLVEKYFA